MVAELGDSLHGLGMVRDEHLELRLFFQVK